MATNKKQASAERSAELAGQAAKAVQEESGTKTDNRPTIILSNANASGGGGNTANGNSEDNTVSLKGKSSQTQTHYQGTGNTSSQSSEQTSHAEQKTQLAPDTDPDKIRLMAEANRDINKAHFLDENGNFDSRTWQEMTGVDPEYTQKLLDAREDANRKKVSALALVNAFKALATAGGAAAGGIMPQVNVERGADDAIKDIYTTQALRDAERNRLAQIAMENQRAGNLARQQAKLNIENMLATKLSDSQNNGSQYGEQSGFQQGGSSTIANQTNEQQMSRYNAVVSNAKKMYEDGLLTKEQYEALTGNLAD